MRVSLAKPGDTRKFVSLAKPGDKPKGVSLEKRYMNVYETLRSYGGPEEGGWYFDTGELVCTANIVGMNDNEIQALVEKMREEYPNERRPLWSVLHRPGDTHDFIIEDHSGQSWPTEYPTYS